MHEGNGYKSGYVERLRGESGASMKIGQAFSLALIFLLISQAKAATSSGATVASNTSHRAEIENARQSGDDDTSSISFKGLQLLPSLDSKWTPGQYDDLKTRLGILSFSLGPVVVTNAFTSGDSQLGSGVRFAHETVAIKRLDGTILLVNTLGNSVALFDPALGGRQTFPGQARNFAAASEAGITVSMQTGVRLSFAKLPFLNYRGEEMFLLHKLVTPGGKEASFVFSVPDTTRTPVYSRIGDLAVSGSAQQGQVVFQDTRVPALKYTLEYRSGMLQRVLGTANEVIGAFEASNGLVSAFTDKYGYRTSFTYTQGRLSGSCSHYGACVVTTFGSDSLRITSNTRNDVAETKFDLTRGLPVSASSGGWVTTFAYEPSRSPQRWRLVNTESKSSIGAAFQKRYTYDSQDRLLKYSDNTSYEVTYTYSAEGSPVYFEPSAVKATLAGNTVQDSRYQYDTLGLLLQEEDLLVKDGAPTRSVAYTYNNQRQLQQVRYADGTMSAVQYGDSSNPDFVTSFLTNGYGAVARLAPNGQLGSIAAVPSGPATSFEYGTHGLMVAMDQQVPALGSSLRWQGTYVQGDYLSAEKISETNQGTTVTTYDAKYTWDDQFRAIVGRQLKSSDQKSGLPKDGAIPLQSFMDESSLATELTTTSAIPGVKPDATGCSPCAQLPETDVATGATIPGPSQCDPKISLVSNQSYSD